MPPPTSLRMGYTNYTWLCTISDQHDGVPYDHMCVAARPSTTNNCIGRAARALLPHLPEQVLLHLLQALPNPFKTHFRQGIPQLLAVGKSCSPHTCIRDKDLLCDIPLGGLTLRTHSLSSTLCATPLTLCMIHHSQLLFERLRLETGFRL